MPPVGFIGLGNMGAPLAGRLLAAGQALYVHDLRAQAVAPLLAQGAEEAPSALAVGERCEVVITCLLTMPSIQDALLSPRGVGAGRATRTVVNTSTIGRQAALDIAEQLAVRGIQMVDCPVSGGPPGAAAGTLSVMASGPSAALAAVTPLLQCWGTLTVAGAQPGQAQVLKLTNNILSAVALAATAEAFVAGAKAGLDPEIMTAAVNAGSGRNSMTLDKIPRSVLDRSFAYGGPISTLMKDVELALSQGEALGVPMRVCQMARAVLQTAVDEGMAGEDVTAIVKLLERQATFELPRTR